MPFFTRKKDKTKLKHNKSTVGIDVKQSISPKVTITRSNSHCVSTDSPLITPKSTRVNNDNTPFNQKPQNIQHILNRTANQPKIHQNVPHNPQKSPSQSRFPEPMLDVSISKRLLGKCNSQPLEASPRRHSINHFSNSELSSCITTATHKQNDNISTQKYFLERNKDYSTGSQFLTPESGRRNKVIRSQSL